MEKMNFEGLPAQAIEYISALEQRVGHLTEMLHKLQKMQFGQRSEKAKYVLNIGSSRFGRP